MKKANYVNELLQASIFPAVILWVALIVVLATVNLLLGLFELEFRFENLGLLFVAISFAIVYVISLYLMNKTYGEKYHDPD